MSLISNTIVWLILGIAIPIYFLKERLGRQLTYNATEGAGNDGPITRSTRLEKGQPLVTSPDPSIKTLYDVLLHGVRVYPASRHLFGKRTVIGTVEEEKQVTKLVNGVKTQETKKWSFFKLSHYEWLTYRDVQDITTKMGQGLVSLGLKQKDKVAIFHSTSY
jgi:long-chain acyl-CoA synthetase